MSSGLAEPEGEDRRDHGTPLRISADWLLDKARRGDRHAAAVLLDKALQAVRDSSMESEVRGYLANFLSRLLDRYSSSPFRRRDAAVALSGLKFPRRALGESDLPVRARAAIREDASLDAIGEYLGGFFDQAIALHRLSGSGQRALEPSLEALYPFDGRGRPELSQDELDMLAARVLVADHYADAAAGRRLSIKRICEFLADHLFDELPQDETQTGEAYPVEDPLLEKAWAAYPLDAYLRAWAENGEQLQMLFVTAGQDRRALLPEAEALARLPDVVIRELKSRNRRRPSRA